MQVLLETMQANTASAAIGLKISWQYTCSFMIYINRLNWKLSLSILWPKSKVSSIRYRQKYWIFENRVSQIFSNKIAIEPYICALITKISKSWHWKSSYYNWSYQNPENIGPPTIKNLTRKFHIEPALLWASLQ